jgi:hypothetical protein
LIHGDTNYLGAILPNEFVSLRKTSNGKIELKHGVKLLGRYDTIQLIPTKADFAIRIDPKTPVLKQRRYADGFKVFVKNDGLKLVK